jgi:hypothetical protein
MARHKQTVQKWLYERGEGWKAIITLLLASFMEAAIAYSLKTWSTLLPALELKINVAAQDVFTFVIAAICLGLWILKKERWLRWGLISYVGYLTFFLMVDVMSIVITVPMSGDFAGHAGGMALIWDTLFLWLDNILLFSVWYWVLDGGGPDERNIHEEHDFLFPQHVNPLPRWSGWLPRFMDYAFISFNTNTTFGPADVMVLTRRMKVLMMTQVSLSLIILTIIATHALSLMSS